MVASMWFLGFILGLTAAAPNIPSGVTFTPITRETLPPLGKKCKPQETVNVTDFWSLPLTQIDVLQYCYYQFNIPVNSYAVVDIFATGMHPDDNIEMGDDFGDQLYIRSQNKQQILTNHGAWPGSFGIHLVTNLLSEMKLAINITIYTAIPSANIVLHTNVAKDGPSALLYMEDIQAGASYSYSAQSGQVYMDLPSYSAPNRELRNVFIYSNGKLVGTLSSYEFNENVFHNKTFSGEILLYAPLKPQTEGVVLLIDQQNVPKNFLTYATINFCQEKNTTIYNYADLTTTLIGAKDQSTTITVTRISGPGQYSYSPGGPVTRYRNVTLLSEGPQNTQLFKGNIWTFHVSSGPGEMDISWTPINC